MRIFLFTLILLSGLLLSDVAAQKSYHIEEAKSKIERFNKWSAGPETISTAQGNYDVTFYNINLDLDPDKKMLTGRVSTTATILSSAMTELELNFSSNMIVDSVYANGALSSFSHSSHLLQINLGRQFNHSEIATVTVFYHGKPASTGLGSFGFDEHNDKPMIWTLSEPYGAREWWPCKDIPADKADSVDIVVTVPEGMIVASNGSLFKEITKNGKTTFFWQERYPVSTYLISLAAYEYLHYSDSYTTLDGKKVPLEFYVFPDNYEIYGFKENYAKTKQMMHAFAELFGEYPFQNEKYGHAEFLWGGGMEHQTCTSLGGWGEGLIAHELAHQWWGDMITCRDFHHIWLNEGFATYSEALWREYDQGIHAYHKEMSYNAYKGGGTIYVNDDTNVGKIFDSGLSYNKASYVLHMLRHVVGDTIFFNIIKTYYNDSRFQYGTITTSDFQQICENVSGLDLAYFFRQWIYGQYYPAYEYVWETETIDNKYELTLKLTQAQTNTDLFKMPLDIHISTTAGDTVIVIVDSLQYQEFRFSLNNKPQSLAIDPYNWVLKSVEELIKPDLDQGVLLVNGVNWGKYGSEIEAAYEAKAFWGDYPISFFDVFDDPAEGYPESLPVPIGHGEIDPAMLFDYSTVVWVGGDGIDWIRFYYANVMDYLKLGGNLILITPNGKSYLAEPAKQDYLGITFFDEQMDGIAKLISNNTNLEDMDTLKYMENVSVFNISLRYREAFLLFSDSVGTNNCGLGIWRQPAAGTIFKENGGQFVFIAAQPFRLEHHSLRNNMQYFLNEFGETATTLEVNNHSSFVEKEFNLSSVYPNPFNNSTTISFTINKQTALSISIYNVLGKKVSQLLTNKTYNPGAHKLLWNAYSNASGIYFIRVESGKSMQTKKTLLVK